MLRVLQLSDYGYLLVVAYKTPGSPFFSDPGVGKKRKQKVALFLKRSTAKIPPVSKEFQERFGWRGRRNCWAKWLPLFSA